jgi:hypothetical protein
MHLLLPHIALIVCMVRHWRPACCKSRLVEALPARRGTLTSTLIRDMCMTYMLEPRRSEGLVVSLSYNHAADSCSPKPDRSWPWGCRSFAHELTSTGQGERGSNVLV